MIKTTKVVSALAQMWQHRLTAGAALLGLLTIAVLWGGLLFHLAQREAAAIDQSHREVASLSVAFEEHVERLVAGINQVMRFAQADFSADPSRFDLQVWYQRAEALRVLDAQMSLVDAQGRAVAATYPLVAGPPSDASQRPFFRTHAERGDVGLLIDPVVTGRSTGTPIILFSRRLSLPDGGFGGVITVSLNPQHLAGAFAAADLGPGGSVTLIGRDGFVRARTPSYPGVYERSLRENPAGQVLFEHLERGTSGTCRIGSAVDGSERIFGYRTVSTLPLVVAVGRSVADVLAPVQAERRRAMVLGAFATLVIAVFSLLFVRELERRRRREEDVVRTSGELAAAEAQVRRANHFLLIAEEMAHVGHWRVELPSLRQTWSPEIFRIYGLEPSGEAPTVEAAIAAYHPEDRARVEAHVNEAVASGQSFEFQLRLVRPSGEVRNVMSRGSVERDEDGAVTALFGVFFDITEMKRAEAETHKANRMLLMAEEVAHVGHWRVEVPSNRLTWSDEIFRIYGLDPASFRPTVEAAIAAYHPDDRDEVARCVGQAVSAREPFEFTLRIVRPDGELRHVLSRGRCELGDAGEVTAVFGAFLDVTDLRQAEQKASETSGLLSTTLESMDQGLIVVSPGRTIEICNRRAQELLDLPSELMRSKPTTQAVLDHQWAHGEFDGAEEPIRRLMREGGTAFGPHTYTRTRPNGTVLEIRTMPMTDGGLVRTYTDVTARYATEQAIAEKTAMLETTLENMDQGLVMIAADGRVQVSNGRLSELLNLPPELLARRPDFEDVLAYMAEAGEFADTDPAFQARVRDRGTPLTLGTYERRRPTGAILEVRTTALPDGGVVRTYADITARRAAEQAVVESEARYRLLAETTSDVITRLSLDFKREYVSPACRRLLGYEPQEMLGSQPSAAMHPDDAPAVRDLARRLVAGEVEGDKTTATYRTRHKDGRWVWVEAGMMLARDAMGQATSIVCSLRDISERMEAEAAVRESEARLSALADALPQKVWLADRDGTALYYNRRMLEYHGPVGTSLADRIGLNHPDDAPRMDALRKSSYAQGIPFEVEGRLRRHDGAWRWNRLVMIPTRRSPEGEVAEWLGTSLDIHDIITAKEEVERTTSLLRLAQEAAGAGLFKWDLTTNRAWLSPESLRFFGIPEDRGPEIDAGECIAALHPDDVAVVQQAAEHAAATGGTYRAEVRIALPGAPTRWLMTIGRVIADDGQASHIVGLNLDVTERRKAEAALRESETRYRLLADNVSDLIILGHADGRRSYISPAVRSLLGYTVEEAHRIGMREWLHPDDLPKVFATTAGLTPEKPTASVVYRLKHKAGHYVWAEAAFQRVEDAAEVTIITAIRDVTERVRQEQHLERARVAAEAGARVKAEFLANMSHELRTPLTGMLGVHDLLTSDPALSERQRHFVSLAQESGRSLLTIVNDILDFSKIEAGQMTIERVPFSLRELVDSCGQLATETLKSKRLNLQVDVAADVPDLLFGDPTRLRQVLLNLTTNAVKFTAEGSIAISASWTQAGALRLSVSDTGIGIAPDVIPQLFERFSQADTSTTRRFGGTGLGLAICKRLVELMGGQIGIESTPGQGSTFWFELPLQPAEQDRRGGKRASTLGAAAVRAWRILVAEDNSINQEIVRTVLARKGHQVTMVSDGAEAVAAYRSGTFDVVLMDVQMPILDGLAATGEIRALERSEVRSPTPIIALTANAMAEEAERCRQAGMDAHVAKPIDWTQLFVTVDRLCGQHASPEQVGPHSSSDVPVLDESALDTLALLLGRERIGDLLTSFEREMLRRLGLIETPSATTKDLGDHAHALVSLAGQLGFMELSTLCMQLEDEALKGGGLNQIGGLRIVAERALAAAAGSSYAPSATPSASAA